MPTVVSRKRYLPVDGWGPPPKRPLTGRERRPSMPADAVYVGRGSPLGNPYRIDHRTGEVFDPMGDRVGFGVGDALRLYRVWLHEKLTAEDARVMVAMRSIGPDTLLVCSCAPKPCHADRVLSAWMWLKNTGAL